MGLEITGDNSASGVEKKPRGNRGQGGESRSQRNEDRKGGADRSFQSITEMLRPRLGSKAIGVRGDLIHKWIRLSLAESEELVKEYTIKVGPISREQGYDVHYPGIIISVNKIGTTRVAAHVLLVADGVELEPKGKRRIFRGEDITPYPVPSMVWDKTYEDQVRNEIAKMYEEMNDVKFASMGCTVIPSTMHISAYGEKPSNDDNPLDALFVNVVESLTSFERFLSRDSSLVRLGEAFDPRTQMISANVDQIPAIEFDVVGQPRRSDFCISLSVKRRRDDRSRDLDVRESYNQESTADSGTILRVAGYVLPYYTEIDVEKRKPQNFGINIVIVDISGESTPSPELFLYGLAATSILTSNDMWVDGFKPSIMTATPNRNLGGLFLEIPDKNNEAMERRTYANTANEDLLDDVDFLFSDRVKVSIDCSESGPLTWITDMVVFNEYQNLFAAADNLSSDEFDKISKKDYSIIEKNETRRFYVGSAEGDAGLVDIREVDYLHQINFYDEHRSLAAAKKWDLSIAESSEQGLWERRMLTDEVYGHGGYKITGHVDRVVINSDFFTDLVDSLEELEMLPSFDSYSKNHRPKSRLEAKDVHGTMSSRELGSSYRGSSSRSTSRGRSNFRDRD